MENFVQPCEKTSCNLVGKTKTVKRCAKHRENAVKRRAKTEFVSLRSTFLDRFTGFFR
jgi:NADH:ubiquinone oxidoreductase subunit E